MRKREIKSITCDWCGDEFNTGRAVKNENGWGYICWQCIENNTKDTEDIIDNLNWVDEEE